MEYGAHRGNLWRRVIGIVGGLGPHAHIELERLLLAETERHLGEVVSDQDYPAWILSSLPGTADRTQALIGEGSSPLPDLVLSARRLLSRPDASGADFVVIPCNTAHAFLPELRRYVPLPFLDMIGETVREALERIGPGGTVGVLATTGTLRAGLYQRAIHERARMVTPLDLPDGERLQEECIMTPIYGPRRDGRRLGGGIKAGRYRDPEKLPALAGPLRRACEHLASSGARLVITACTEIPLVLGRKAAGDVPLLDPLAVAAKACIDIASGDRPLPS